MGKRDTSRNKKALNRACFAHTRNLSTARLSNWGDPQKFAKQTAYDSKTIIKSRNIIFDKFIKSVIRLLGEY
jgi:DNA-binding transcriptional regulator YiaG